MLDKTSNNCCQGGGVVVARAVLRHGGDWTILHDLVVDCWRSSGSRLLLQRLCLLPTALGERGSWLWVSLPGCYSQVKR
jgi:hypothetical protein